MVGGGAGTGFRPHGSLTLAGDDAEAALLREAAALPDAAERGYELLGEDAGREPSIPRCAARFCCGLLGRKDAIVEPRQVPAAIRDYLLATASGDGYTWLPGPRGRRRRTWRGA